MDLQKYNYIEQLHLNLRRIKALQYYTDIVTDNLNTQNAFFVIDF